MLGAILTGLLVSYLPKAPAAYAETLKRDFSEHFTAIAIDNPDGITEARIWASPAVRVIASRQGTNSVLDSEVSFERPAHGRLRIVVGPNIASDPITLTVYVPSSAHVAVTTVRGSVTIRGALTGLSVETDSGAVAVHLPKDSNADLSLRALEGAIESKLPVKLFGQADAHRLDGRIGQGGSTMIVRSLRGNISISLDDVSRVAEVTKTSNLVDPIDRLGSGTKPTGGKADLAFAATNASTGGDVIRTGEELIKLEARLVTLNVKVADAGGKTLPALKKEDFVVYEDGLHQDISYFEPITAPLHIVLLLDLSGSTEKKMKVLKEAAQKFVDSLKPSDTIAVAGFTRRFFIISNFTTDHKLLNDRIDDIKNRHSGTAYYDAMWATLDLLDEAKATRKAIVVLTDGVDNSLDHPDDSDYDPKHGFDKLLARVEEADATIYPIYLDTEYETIGRNGRSGHEAYVTARKQLDGVAEQTGAVMFKAERAEDLEGVYQQVAAELHSLYSMAYAPKVLVKDGKWRRISIAVSLPGAKARTKRGYFAK